MDTAFDSLRFYEDLKSGNVPEDQALAHAEAMRTAFAAYEASRMQENATRGDIVLLQGEMRETELRLQKEIELVRADIEVLRGENKATELSLRKEIETVRGEIKDTELRLQNEIKETELRLRKEIKATEWRLLRWQWAVAAALAAIMAKGFNWVGF